ncbi:hypothetical protein ACN47E_001269 [Coniothyrium glycines]
MKLQKRIMIREKKVHFTKNTFLQSAACFRNRCARMLSQGLLGHHYCPRYQTRVDTSFMMDENYQILHLPVHSVVSVRDECHASALMTTLEVKMQAGMQLSAGTNILVRHHPLRDMILQAAEEWVNPDKNQDRLIVWGHAILEATSIAVYKHQTDGLLGLQFLKDIRGDHEVTHYIENLKQNIPEVNRGLHRDIVLQRIRTEQLGTMT